MFTSTEKAQLTNKKTNTILSWDCTFAHGSMLLFFLHVLCSVCSSESSGFKQEVTC